MSFHDFAATFAELDVDGDGLVTAAELQALMTRLGGTLDDATAAAMISFIDVDGDGKVTRDDLLSYLSGA
jgi:Ca2+-binding EF-hand superfamily protein